MRFLYPLLFALVLCVGCEALVKGSAATTQALNSSAGQAIASGAAGIANTVFPGSGLLVTTILSAIGAIAGVVCYFGATALKNALGYDDSLDVFGVHGIGGAVGAILTGVFATSAINAAGSGLIDGNGAQIITQLKGVGFTIVYTAIVSFIILKAIDLVMGLRVSEDVERDGLDLGLHGETVQ